MVLGGASGRGPLFPSKHFEGILCLESGERRPACPPGGLERRPGGARWIHSSYERGSRLAHESKSWQERRGRDSNNPRRHTNADMSAPQAGGTAPSEASVSPAFRPFVPSAFYDPSLPSPEIFQRPSGNTVTRAAITSAFQASALSTSSSRKLPRLHISQHEPSNEYRGVSRSAFREASRHSLCPLSRCAVSVSVTATAAASLASSAECEVKFAKNLEATIKHTFRRMIAPDFDFCALDPCVQCTRGNHTKQ